MNLISKTVVAVNLLICFTCGEQLCAQQNHFIYIQSDKKQTFDVSIDGKIYNSSEVGHVIIPKLPDGKYDLTIHFPGKKFPDQQFVSVINETDIGYDLKNFGEKGWGLFNLQTQEITMAESGKEMQPDTAKTNAFGNMLSEVVNDTTLKNVQPQLVNETVKNQDVIVPETGKPAAVIPLAPVAISGDSVLNGLSSIVDASLIANSRIHKIKQETTADGEELVFVDTSPGINDTIRILMPAFGQETQNSQPDSLMAVNAMKDSPAQSNNQKLDEMKNESSQTIGVNDTTKVTNSGVNNPFYSKNTGTDSLKQYSSKNSINTSSTENAEQISLVNMQKAGCGNVLTDKDMDKLTKKLGSVSESEKMIQAVKKYFEGKCVSSEQVKNLSVLFGTDDARYSFFDTAYSYVYDVENFPALENLLVDPYYKKRFRAMLK